MANEVALFEGKLPSFLKGYESETTKALAGSSGGIPRISIKGGVFREIIGGKEARVNEDRAMNIVIVKSAPKVSRTYYSGAYQEGVTVAPTCWSSDSDRPDPSVKNPQASRCIDCPQNVKGSGQGESRACRFSQRLAVMLEGAMEQGTVYQLTLPSTSIFGDGDRGRFPLQKYARMLATQSVPVEAIVTEMRFDTSSPTPKLVFKAVRAVTEQEWAHVQTAMASPEAKEAVSMTVFQADGSKETKAAAPSLPKPAASAGTPVSSDTSGDEEDGVPEPKVEKSKKQAPAAQPDLAALVNEWDD